MKPGKYNYRLILTGLVCLEGLALLLMGCGDERATPVNPNYSAPVVAPPGMGSYKMELSINDFSLENLIYRPYLKEYIGYWEFTLDAAGIFSVSNNKFLITGLYRLTSDKLIFYGTAWLSGCSFSEMSNEIGYRWKFSGDNLNLISLEDDCFDRSMVLTAHSWVLST